MGIAAAVTGFRRHAAVLAAAMLLAEGCAVLPADLTNPGPSVTQKPTAATSAATMSPGSSACSAAVENDDVGHGQTFTARGYPPDVPLTMTLAGDTGSVSFTEADFPELRSDIRGAFQLHLYAARADVGKTRFTLTGGGCSAAHDFEVPAQF